jgi:hypothetical protein
VLSSIEHADSCAIVARRPQRDVRLRVAVPEAKFLSTAETFALS